MIYKNNLIWLLKALNFDLNQKEFYRRIQQLTDNEVIATDGIVAHILHAKPDGYVAEPSKDSKQAAAKVKELLSLEPDNRIILDADLLIQALSGFDRSHIYLEIYSNPDREPEEGKYLVLRFRDKIAMIISMHGEYAAFDELRIEEEPNE